MGRSPLNAVLTTLKANPEWVLARGVTIGLWLLALAGSLIAFAPVPRAWERLALGIETVSILPLLALLAAGILRFVYRSRRLTIDGVFATIIVYMIVAIFFSRLYLLLLGVDPQALDLPVPMASRTSQLLQVDLLYYNLITQCSVGYGDILPVSDAARMLAVIQVRARAVLHGRGRRRVRRHVRVAAPRLALGPACPSAQSANRIAAWSIHRSST